MVPAGVRQRRCVAGAAAGPGSGGAPSELGRGLTALPTCCWPAAWCWVVPRFHWRPPPRAESPPLSRLPPLCRHQGGAAVLRGPGRAAGIPRKGVCVLTEARNTVTFCQRTRTGCPTCAAGHTHAWLDGEGAGLTSRLAGLQGILRCRAGASLPLPTGAPPSAPLCPWRSSMRRA